MNEEWKKDRFGAIERGENPMVLAKMKSGYAVIGDTQFLRNMEICGIGESCNTPMKNIANSKIISLKN